MLAAFRHVLTRTKSTELDVGLCASWKDGMDVIQPHTSRIRRLTIASLYAPGSEIYALEFPLLRELVITYPHFSDDSLHFGQPALLRSLKIELAWTSLDSLWSRVSQSLLLSKLTHLEIIRANVPGHITLSGGIPAWYKDCPSLVYLKDQTLYSLSLRVALRKPLIMEHLRSLECDLCLYQLLTCPALQTVSLRKSSLRRVSGRMTKPLLDFLSRSECAANFTVELDLMIADSSFNSGATATHQGFFHIVAEARRLLIRLEPESFAAKSDTLAFFTTLGSRVNQRDAEWVAAPHIQTLVLVFSSECTSHLCEGGAPPELMTMVDNRTGCTPNFRVEVEFQTSAGADGVGVMALQESTMYHEFELRGVDIRITKMQETETNEKIALL